MPEERRLKLLTNHLNKQIWRVWSCCDAQISSPNWWVCCIWSIELEVNDYHLVLLCTAAEQHLYLLARTKLELPTESKGVYCWAVTMASTYIYICALNLRSQLEWLCKTSCRCNSVLYMTDYLCLSWHLQDMHEHSHRSHVHLQVHMRHVLNSNWWACLFTCIIW